MPKNDSPDEQVTIYLAIESIELPPTVLTEPLGLHPVTSQDNDGLHDLRLQKAAERWLETMVFGEPH